MYHNIIKKNFLNSFENYCMIWILTDKNRETHTLYVYKNKNTKKKYKNPLQKLSKSCQSRSYIVLYPTVYGFYCLLYAFCHNTMPYCIIVPFLLLYRTIHIVMSHYPYNNIVTDPLWHRTIPYYDIDTL